MPTARRARLTALLFASLLLFALTAVRLQSTSAATQAGFIDVGQGDAILLRDGNGFDVLIDGGRPCAARAWPTSTSWSSPTPMPTTSAA